MDTRETFSREPSLLLPELFRMSVSTLTLIVANPASASGLASG